MDFVNISAIYHAMQERQPPHYQTIKDQKRGNVRDVRDKNCMPQQSASRHDERRDTRSYLPQYLSQPRHRGQGWVPNNISSNSFPWKISQILLLASALLNTSLYYQNIYITRFSGTNLWKKIETSVLFVAYLTKNGKMRAWKPYLQRFWGNICPLVRVIETEKVCHPTWHTLT